MQPIPLARIEYLQPIADELRDRGEPLEELLAAAGLPGRLVPGRFVPTLAAWRFAELAARRTGRSDFGLCAGVRVAPRRVDSWIEASDGARTLGAALARWCEVVEVESSGIELWLEPTYEGSLLCYRGSFGPETTGFRVVEQYMIGMLVGVLRDWLGTEWRPGAVRLRAAEAPAQDAHGVLARTSLRTAAERTAVELCADELDRPVWSDGAPAGTDSDLARRPAEDFVGSLEQALEGYVGERGSQLQLAARLAGTSVRSLQRALASSGRTVSDMLDELRKQAAIRRMCAPQPGVTEVAHELGYSDSAHFTRAFRRWTGVTPSEWRAARARRL